MCSTEHRIFSLMIHDRWLLRHELRRSNTQGLEGCGARKCSMGRTPRSEHASRPGTRFVRKATSADIHLSKMAPREYYHRRKAPHEPLGPESPIQRGWH